MFYVYILASRRNGTIYVGSTDDLARRMWEHQNGVIAGFTKKYGVKPSCGSSGTSAATTRSRGNGPLRIEPRMEGQLIEASNPDWHDLTAEIFD